MPPKISDFGLSKTGPADQSCTHVSTKVKGTFGYLDPEYISTRRLTRKSDVYAFGVVLFEVLSGRRAVDVSLMEEQWNLAMWAKQCVKERRVDHLIDTNLEWEIFPNSLNAFAQIASQCLHYKSKERPTMAEVVASLESALAFQQKRDSSMVEMENFDIFGTHENQENVDSSSAEQQEVIDVGREYDGNSRLPLVKPAKITGFRRMVRQFFQGTVQATPVHGTAEPPKQGKSSNNSSDSSTLATKDEDIQQFTRNLKIFTYSELEAATRNFEPGSMIGEGTFGKVYKGWVNEETYGPSEVGVGMAIAVKKFDLKGFQEYVTWQLEVELLEKLSHPNIVNVFGYCLEMGNFLVVYEYMERGSLERYLFGSKLWHSDGKPLSWCSRLNIAVGAARGFDFLHSTKGKDVYRQFKSHNILLDRDFNAKLSDIQLAEISYSFADYYFPGVPRTVVRRYDFSDVPPEYMSTGHLNKKGHIYCLGVLLFELLIGAQASSVTKRNGNRRLEDHAQEMLSTERKVIQIIDPSLEGAYPIKDVYQYAQLTLKCLNRNPKKRPSMDEILKTLEHIDKKSNIPPTETRP